MATSGPDRGFDYDAVAPAYDAHRTGGGPYLETLVSMARSANARRVLEVAAGTGNNTAAFLSAHDCALTAVDLSAGMLKQARAKGIPAYWVQGAARDLPIASGGVNFMFGVYFLHYIADLEGFAAECHRVLRGGGAAFVTASHRYIEKHPMNAYFPSFAAVDKARFPALESVTAALSSAGFVHARADIFVDIPRPIGPEFVDKVANKFISTYALLPPDEFDEGLARLRSDVAARGRLEVELAWESVLIRAEKRTP